MPSNDDVLRLAGRLTVSIRKAQDWVEHPSEVLDALVAAGALEHRGLDQEYTMTGVAGFRYAYDHYVVAEPPHEHDWRRIDGVDGYVDTVAAQTYAVCIAPGHEGRTWRKGDRVPVDQLPKWEGPVPE